MNLINEAEWLFNLIKDHPIKTAVFAIVGAFLTRTFNDYMDKRKRMQIRREDREAIIEKEKREKANQEVLDNEQVWITEKQYETLYRFENRHKTAYPKYTQSRGFSLLNRNLLTGEVRIKRKRTNNYEKKSGKVLDA